MSAAKDQTYTTWTRKVSLLKKELCWTYRRVQNTQRDTNMCKCVMLLAVA